MRRYFISAFSTSWVVLEPARECCYTRLPWLVDFEGYFDNSADCPGLMPTAAETMLAAANTPDPRLCSIAASAVLYIDVDADEKKKTPSARVKPPRF